MRPLYICGPTASGKSAKAIEMARELNGEIVNADAFQLYRGIEILSAAPSAEEQAVVPHHLYGILDPTESCNAGAYHRLAMPVIHDILKRGKTPIITGGSGLYLKFLTHGPSPLPEADPELRQQLDATPLEELVARLQQLDPVEAARTDPHNRRFVSRALEICLLSGEKTSDLRDRWEAKTLAITHELSGILMQVPRPELHARIAQRTRRMLENGAIDEVASLAPSATHCRKAIGIPEIQSLLNGEIDLPTCEQRIITATRQYAKRQETWFRRESWLTASHA